MRIPTRQISKFQSSLVVPQKWGPSSDLASTAGETSHKFVNSNKNLHDGFDSPELVLSATMDGKKKNNETFSSKIVKQKDIQYSLSYITPMKKASSGVTGTRSKKSLERTAIQIIDSLEFDLPHEEMLKRWDTRLQYRIPSID